MKYFYYDFITRKKHFTRGKFVDWQRGGIMNAWHAQFKRPHGVLFVPIYLITTETLMLLPPLPKETASPQESNFVASNL